MLRGGFRSLKATQMPNGLDMLQQGKCGRLSDAVTASYLVPISQRKGFLMKRAQRQGCMQNCWFVKASLRDETGP